MQILCKAKDLYSGNWIYGYYLEDQEAAKIYELDTNTYHVIDKDTVGICIDLYDIRDNLVFTGDIVRCADSSNNTRVFYVDFDSRLASYVFVDSLDKHANVFTLFDLQQYELGESMQIKIIGNIHDSAKIFDSDN